MAKKINSFTDLEAWQVAHSFAVTVYRATKKFPASEQYGLSSQLRRASVSIGSNIAEGFTRQSTKEKIQFYSVARGSTVESQSQLLLPRDVEFLTVDECKILIDQSIRVHKLVNGLISSVKSWSLPNTKSQIPKASVKLEVQ